ncbi:MAG: N-acyl-D-aspartate/D-glutamate deacylase, partial [Akkermansiaceae bacterium]|nr:N-acyl-D-aspartate/D-glutamate deacylase [Akkermansiaceae bacterium]
MTPKRLWRGLPVLAGLVTISLGAPSVSADPARTDPAVVTQAVQAGLRILQKGTLGYSEKQNCFTCHNQTLPMLAQATARKHGFKINEELLHEQARFTHESFEERTSSLRRGKGIGGQSMTVAFGLWALDLAEWQPGETTEAMADFL